jgi:dolichol-phosphate mannosyltransferase
MINFALEGITSFSTKPLRVASLLGFAAATLGFLGIIYAIVGKIFLPSYWVTGWTALFVGIMFLGGVQLITIGIIGEYIGKIYKEVQKRPQYIIREQINVKAS